MRECQFLIGTVQPEAPVIQKGYILECQFLIGTVQPKGEGEKNETRRDGKIVSIPYRYGTTQKEEITDEIKNNQISVSIPYRYGTTTVNS